jgi:site-specific recombinase
MFAYLLTMVRSLSLAITSHLCVCVCVCVCLCVCYAHVYVAVLCELPCAFQFKHLLHMHLIAVDPNQFVSVVLHICSLLFSLHSNLHFLQASVYMSLTHSYSVFIISVSLTFNI